MKHNSSLYSIYTHPPPRIDKVSSYIEWKEALGFFNVLDAFQLEGKGVNTLVTINLEWLGIKPKLCPTYARESIQRLRRLIQKSGSPWAIVWVLENSIIVGIHLHFLIHRSSKLLINHHLFENFYARPLELKGIEQGQDPSAIVNLINGVRVMSITLVNWKATFSRASGPR